MTAPGLRQGDVLVEPKRYRTLVVDPPWNYNDQGGRHGIQYAGSVQDSLLALPIRNWAEKNAHLYIWTTNAFMIQAHELAEAWGFQQKTILTWAKAPRGSGWLGMGRYFRNVTEHVVFSVRGKLGPAAKDCPTLFYGQRGRHSEKPAAFYDMVESMSPGPYLDVFARKQRFGWDVWGDQVYCAEGLPTPDEVREARLLESEEVTE